MDGRTKLSTHPDSQPWLQGFQHNFEIIPKWEHLRYELKVCEYCRYTGEIWQRAWDTLSFDFPHLIYPLTHFLFCQYWMSKRLNRWTYYVWKQNKTSLVNFMNWNQKLVRNCFRFRASWAVVMFLFHRKHWGNIQCSHFGIISEICWNPCSQGWEWKTLNVRPFILRVHAYSKV